LASNCIRRIAGGEYAHLQSTYVLIVNRGNDDIFLTKAGRKELSQALGADNGGINLSENIYGICAATKLKPFKIIITRKVNFISNHKPA
jgi:hypothetical protein